MRKNSSRENRLEELGRVDAESADTAQGHRNLKQERSRIERELNHPVHSSHIEEMGSAYESNSVSSGARQGYHPVVTAARMKSTKE